jgi:hypothetical protein
VSRTLAAGSVPHRPHSVVCPECKSLLNDLQSTDKEMIPVRNAIDAHAQRCVANGELLIKVNITLEQAAKAQRWSRGIAVLFL